MRSSRDHDNHPPALSPLQHAAPVRSAIAGEQSAAPTWVLTEIDLATGFTISRLRFECEPVVEN